MTAGSSANSSHALVPVATARSVAWGADSPTSSTVTLISDTGLHSSVRDTAPIGRGQVRESYPRGDAGRAVVSCGRERSSFQHVPAVHGCAPRIRTASRGETAPLVRVDASRFEVVLPVRDAHAPPPAHRRMPGAVAHPSVARGMPGGVLEALRVDLANGVPGWHAGAAVIRVGDTGFEPVTSSV